MTLPSIVQLSKRLNWTLEMLVAGLLGWLSVTLYGQETGTPDASLTQQARQVMAKASQPATLVSTGLSVAPLQMITSEETSLWTGLQHWLIEQEPVQGACAIQASEAHAPPWHLVCTGFKGKTSLKHPPQSNAWQPLHVLSAPKVPYKAKAKPDKTGKTITRPEGWFLTHQGHTLRFDPIRKTWTRALSP